MKIKKLTRLGIACLSVGVLSAGLLYGAESAATRLKTSGVVFTEIMKAPDKGIPVFQVRKLGAAIILLILNANSTRSFSLINWLTSNTPNFRKGGF